MTTSKSLLLTLSSLLIAGSAAAADAPSAHAEAYAGFNLAAQTRYDLDCVAGSPCDRKAGDSGKIFGGYLGAPSDIGGVSVSQGAELMYYKVGSANAGFQTGSGLKAGRGNTYGLGAAYVVQANFNDFAVNGRLGLAYANSKVDYTAGGSDSNRSFLAPVVGLGVRYALTKNVTLNADYDRLPNKFSSQEKGSVNMFSLGVGYKF